MNKLMLIIIMFSGTILLSGCGITDKLRGNDVLEDLDKNGDNIITEPTTMDLTDSNYLTYKLTDSSTDYEFYYLQIDVSNEMYIIEYAEAGATESIYETGPLEEEVAGIEILRYSQSSGYDELWDFGWEGINLELTLIIYFDEDGIVEVTFDPMTFIPYQ